MSDFSISCINLFGRMHVVIIAFGNFCNKVMNFSPEKNHSFTLLEFRRPF